MYRGRSQRNSGPSNFGKGDELLRPRYVNPSVQQGQGFGNGQQNQGFGNGQQAQGFGGGNQQAQGFGGGNQQAQGFGGGNQQAQGFGGGQQSGFGGSNQAQGFGGGQQAQRFGNGQQSGFGGGDQQAQRFGNQQNQGFGGGSNRGGSFQQSQNFGNNRGAYRGGRGGGPGQAQGFTGRKPKKLSKCQKKYRCGKSGPGKSQRDLTPPDDFVCDWSLLPPIRKVVFPPLPTFTNPIILAALAEAAEKTKPAVTQTLPPITEVSEEAKQTVTQPLPPVSKEVESAGFQPLSKNIKKVMIIPSFDSLMLKVKTVDGKTAYIFSPDEGGIDIYVES